MTDTSEKELLKKIKSMNEGSYEDSDYHNFLQKIDANHYTAMGLKIKYCSANDIDYNIVMKDECLITTLRKIENYFWNKRLTSPTNRV